MPSYWEDFFDFEIDPDELAERLSCNKVECDWYVIVDSSSLGDIISLAHAHFAEVHDA